MATKKSPDNQSKNDIWRAWVFTLYPEAFPGLLGLSLAGRALANGVWRLDTTNFKDHGHRSRADGSPYGGGPGMVLRADVVDTALAARRQQIADLPLLCLSARGEPLTQKRVNRLANGNGVALVCGHFEGIDQRVIDHHRMEEVSVGDYILSGGETAALVLLDACVRLLKGVITDPAALKEESFNDGLLEYPQYTRPAVWRDKSVPSVLVEGNHRLINEWRRQQAEQITRRRRLDLWTKRAKSTTIAASPAKGTKA